ncbi:probable ATP-dependent RNA helicase DDX31 [Macrosteles quadrilineatus]|uniref:probable ATP-dependent RNA helicase DDX31 n=1 Tax=Macrosteles quadrilineatus TaxID=74068 RepID=UPI0023E09C01|nr:probable ATP-dependent RNA helicase DDX31 [Macrosteles quadrilineatus]
MSAVVDSLTLNIGTGYSAEENFTKKTEGKIGKKKNKRFKDDTSAIDNEDEKYTKKRKRSNQDTKQSQTQHVSSLFAHNPEIPNVKSNEIKPVCESVFSSDLYKDCPGIHPYTVKNLEDNFGVTTLTTVQKITLPVLLAGSDALVRSQTGSGKTLAYALPIVESLGKVQPKLSRADGIRALVVLPTRELALQTYECFVKLIRSYAWLVPGLVVGGEKRKSEKARLRKGINILIGTPGRINDHMQNTKAVRLDWVQWLVLDEADRLLDLGYEKEVTSLVQMLDSQSHGGKRQTVLLSATLTAQVERLAGLALTSPARLDASQAADTDLVIPQELRQLYITTPAKLRLVSLAAFIHWKCQVCKQRKMLVFMATQDMVDFHTELLTTVLPQTAEFLRLHGNMTQHDRTKVFQSFKAAKSGVLLCTDVAARGLDLPSVDWIVQYTAPATASDYVHRVGRTARVGHAGSAVLFLVPSEVDFVSHLENKRIRLEEEQMVRCLYNLQTIQWEEDDRAPSGMEAAATTLQLRFETAVLDQKKLHNLACKAYVSWVRFYASYPKDVRDTFNFKELHLGHFAKSFALRDPPTSIGGLGKPSFKQDNQRYGRESRGGRDLQYRPKAPPAVRATVSEFSSGLEPMKKKKKRTPD